MNQQEGTDAVRNALDQFSTDNPQAKTLKTSATLVGTVTLGEIEIKNDAGNPVPVTIPNTEFPLPAAQLVTLTPPTNTGYSTEAKQTDGSQLTGIVDTSITQIDPATSQNQLPDNHNVVVSNMIAEVETGLAKDDTLTNGTQKTIITDGTDTALVTAAGELNVTLPAAQLATLTPTATPTTVLNGKTTVTTAGTRVVLAASTTVKSVTIKASILNTGIIYVGNSTVDVANGFDLHAGDSISLDIANLNTINLDSSVNGESVSYIGNN